MRKKFTSLFVVLILAVTLLVGGNVGGVSAQAAQTTDTTLALPSVNGSLQVIGTQLCDQYGNPVQLRGVSSHGLAWYPEYVNADCLADLHSWGANVFRLAMYTEEYGGYCSGGDQEYLKNLIRKGVNAARDEDMYVIIDWHILSDSNPLTHQAAAKEFFAEMSKEFAGYNNVLYEICNEPNGGTTWSDIKSYAKAIIPVIRANDPDAVIIVGTPTWSQDVDVAAADPITGYSNIMYSLHFYASTHKDDLRSKMESAIKKGLPVFVTEYGICDSSGSGSIDEDSANAWVDLMNDYGVSYVMWNLSNKDESSAILKSSVTKTSGFTYNDLTQSGRWLYNMLQSSSGGSSSTGTELKKDSSGNWYYYVNGKKDTSYTGFASNSNGKWYVENGRVTFSKSSVIKDTTGAIGKKGTWYYVVDSKVQTDFTGLANYRNSNGWWYIKNGVVDFSASGVYKNKNGWWYVTGGKVDFDYNGFASNSNGKWYIEDGKVTFGKSSVIKDTTGAIGKKGTWYYVVDSKVQTDFTGLANYRNSNGWWYIKNGVVDFSASGVYKNKNGWWYVTGGKVDFDYNGFASNSNGKWYIEDGKVTFGKNSVIKDTTGAIGKKGTWYYVVDSKVQTDFTGLANYRNSNGWWYIRNGEVDFTYTGIASNKNGTWYVVDGKVDFSYSGKVKDGGSDYTVVDGKVV